MSADEASTSNLARESEEVLYGKLRWRLLPFLFGGYLLCYMDRTIVGVASLEMNASIGLSAAAYGTGAGLFFLTYLLFEPPSNMILARVGARIWLTRIMVTWGLVTAGTAFIQGETTFYVMRLLLGAAEAGYFPGVIFYIAMWFPPHLRAKPIAIMALGLPIGVMLGSPLGGWILGWGGAVEGWQWLFLVVGLVTVLYGLVMYRYLPSDPSQAAWLTEHDRLTIEANASFDRSPHAFRQQLRGFRLFTRTPALWVLTLIYFMMNVIAYGATFFLPLIVKQFSGLTNLETTLVVSAAWLISIGVVLAIAVSTERTQAPWLHFVILLLISAAGYATLVASSGTVGLFIIAAAAVVSLGSAYAGPFWSIVTPLLGEPGQSAGALALVNGLAATGGYFGPQMLGYFIDRSGGDWQQAPPLAAAALGVSAALVLALWLSRKRGTLRPKRAHTVGATVE